MLDDIAIREPLRKFLFSKSVKPKKILEELRIHDGNAIADVVAVHDLMHGYEIKGENDSVSRLKSQSAFYSCSFPLVSLVTTKNHLRWALNNLDHFWGIILASKENEITKFRYIRGAKYNPLFSKSLSLHMLWKEELMNIGKILDDKTIKKYDSRTTIAGKLEILLTKKETAKMTAKFISFRHLKSTQYIGHVGD